MKQPRDKALAIRLTAESRKRLEDAQAILPYSPSITAIIERGIVLATEEMTKLSTLLRERMEQK